MMISDREFQQMLAIAKRGTLDMASVKLLLLEVEGMRSALQKIAYFPIDEACDSCSVMRAIARDFVTHS